MQRLEVSGTVRPIYGTLGVKRLKEVLADDDLWLQNARHDAVLIGHEAGKKGEEEKKGVGGGRIKHERERC